MSITSLILLAASYIHSPNFGMYVKNTIDLPTSVAYWNTPGSAGFNKQTRSPLSRDACAAFYATYDGYMARFHLPEGRTNIVAFTVSSNFLGNAGRVLGVAQTLRTGGFNEYASSTRFNHFFGNWVPPSGWASVLDLNDWKKFALIANCDKSNLFDFDNDSTHWAKRYVSLVEICERGEFSNGKTVPDLICEIYTNETQVIGATFDDLARDAWEGLDCYIDDIANVSTRTISIRPIAAIGQALALNDSILKEAVPDATEFSSTVHNSYSQTARAECQTFSVKVKYNGDLEIQNPPSHLSPSSIEMGPVKTKEQVVAQGGDGVSVRVSDCLLNASGGGSSDVLKQLGHLVSVEEATRMCGWDGEDVPLPTKIEVTATVDFPHVMALVTVSVEGFGSTSYVSSFDDDLSELSGEKEDVMMIANASASYAYDATDVSSSSGEPVKPFTEDVKPFVSRVKSAVVESYAVSTNAGSAAVDFGYHPYIGATNKRANASMRWGYAARELSSTADGYVAAAAAANALADVSMLSRIFSEIGDYANASPTEPTAYMGFNNSVAGDAMRELSGFSAAFQFSDMTQCFTNSVVPDFGLLIKYYPIQTDVRIGIEVRNEVRDRVIRVPIGGDSKRGVLNRLIFNYPSCQRYDQGY